jgi:hypothetical protein
MLLFGCVPWHVHDSWFKDGRELTDQRKYHIESDARSGILTLTIMNPGETDLGQYECEVGVLYETPLCTFVMLLPNM